MQPAATSITPSLFYRMSNEATQRFDALKEATMALSAMSGEERPPETALRDAVRNLNARRQAMERMWPHVADRDREPYEEQADQAEAMALRKIRQLNPYIKTLEDVRDRHIPVYSPMATRGKRKKQINEATNLSEEEPRPSSSGLQRPGRRLDALVQDHGNGETDYESAGEIDFVRIGTDGEDRPSTNGGSVVSAGDDVEFVRTNEPNIREDSTRNAVDNSGSSVNENGRDRNGGNVDHDAVNDRGAAVNNANNERANGVSGRDRSEGRGSRNGRDRSLGLSDRPASVQRPEGAEDADQDREDIRSQRRGSRGSARDDSGIRNRAAERPARRARSRSSTVERFEGRARSRERSRNRERAVSRSYSRERAGGRQRVSRDRSGDHARRHRRSRSNSRRRLSPRGRERSVGRREDRRQAGRASPGRRSPRRRSPDRSRQDQGRLYRQNRGSNYQNYRQQNIGQSRRGQWDDYQPGSRNRNPPSYRDRDPPNYRERNQPNGRDRSNRNDFPNRANGHRGGLPDRADAPREPFQIRDRAQSWGQQHYYPRESRNFVPPQNDVRFGDLEFPDSWALPAAEDFHRYFTSVDVLPLLGKPNAFGNFNGNIDAYPGWQENFYRIVHVQAVPLIHKVNALDQGVSQDVKNKLFKDLGSSAEDYLLRIRRLEEEFGGSGRHLNQMIKRMKAVGEIGKNYEKVRDATYALERFICSNLCRDREDPFYGEIIKDYLRWDVKREYNAYIHDNKLKDNAVSILEFLKRAVKVKRDDETEKGGKFRSLKDKFRKKKKSTKPEKIAKKDPPTKVKNANYQFFRSPSSESSTESWTESDASGSTDDDTDSDGDGYCNLQTKTEVCDFCEGLHNLFKCLKFFYELTYKERRKWVDNGNRCPLCLRAGHDKDNCKAKRVCRFCKGPHNSCIHVEKKKVASKPPKQPKKPKAVDLTKEKNKAAKVEQNKFLNIEDDSSESDEGVIHSSRREKSNYNVSLTTFVAKIRNPSSGDEMFVNALADGGADHSVLSARAARSLGLWEEGKGSDYFIRGHGGRRGCYTAQKFSIDILGSADELLRKVRVSSYEDPCGDLKIERWDRLKREWPHLKSLPLPEPVGDGVVDLILGSAALDLMEAREPVRFGPPGGPVAKRTSLGWIVGGKTRPNAGSEAENQVEARCNFSMGGRSAFQNLQIKHESETAILRETYRKREDELKHSMKLLWGTKECCREKVRNHVSPAVEDKDDSKARDRFEASLRLDSQGRPEVGLMWRDKSRPANNGSLALRVFLSMERQMKARPGLWEEFAKNVSEWLEKGYAEMLDFHLRNEGFFIPTFMVVREDKSTTKYRLIVNGKFQFNDKSINDYLLSGPNVMNRLDEVLIRFRYHKYVLTCDISNMFLRVGVPQKDRKILKVLLSNRNGRN